MATQGLLPPAEGVLFGMASALWLLAGLTALGILPLAGLFPLALIPFYSFASVCGWLAGNAYVWRHRQLDLQHPRLLALTYLVGPPSLLCFLRTLAPLEHQQAAPLVPVYGLAVYLIFFLVPVTLKQSGGTSWRSSR